MVLTLILRSDAICLFVLPSAMSLRTWFSRLLKGVIGFSIRRVDLYFSFLADAIFSPIFGL